MRVKETDIFWILHLDRCSQEEDSVMSNFREWLRTLKTGLCARPILRMCFIRCASMDDCKRFFLHCPLSSHPKLVTREERSTKRLAPDSLIYLVPATLPMGFSWAMFFCQDASHQRPGDGARQRSRVFLGAQQSQCSIHP